MRSFASNVTLPFYRRGFCSKLYKGVSVKNVQCKCTVAWIRQLSLLEHRIIKKNYYLYKYPLPNQYITLFTYLNSETLLPLSTSRLSYTSRYKRDAFGRYQFILFQNVANIVLQKLMLKTSFKIVKLETFYSILSTAIVKKTHIKKNVSFMTYYILK